MGKNNLKKSIQHIALILILFVLANIVSNYVFARFDLTEDKRYTLSEAAKNTISSVDSPIVVDVFLAGTFPPEFQRLQRETEQLLEEFKAYNSNIVFEFINPLESDNPEALQQLFRLLAGECSLLQALLVEREQMLIQLARIEGIPGI